MKTKKLQIVLGFLKKHKAQIAVIIIFIASCALRLYQPEFKNPFGYDQVDNAWAAKNLIVNHKFPLVGMVAKENSGIYIGPVYYYLVSLFYWIFNLNARASLAISFITSIFTFWTIYYIGKKIFNTPVALIAVIINSFNFKSLTFDGVQWPVQLLPAISLIIFYFLYKTIKGEVKHIIPLAIATGIAFNIHFTAVFFPIIVILCLPLFPRNKETLKYILISLPLFFVWLVPNIFYSLSNRFANSTTSSYLSTYYHGFHLRRLLQLLGDSLIQFNPYLVIDKLESLKFLILPVFFAILYIRRNISGRIRLLYLTLIWFLVPLVIFTTYSGEISDYYFIIGRFVALLILAYFVSLVWNLKLKVAKLTVLIILLAYSFYGITQYLPYKDPANLSEKEIKVQKAVNEGRRIEYQLGVPESYLYYYYMRQKGIEVYISKTR